MQPPQIVEKPELVVIGCEASFIHALSPDATNFEVIGPLWDKFINRMDQAPNRVGHATYGVIYGKPADERSHRDELQYIAGAPVSSTIDVPQGMVAHSIDPTTFAVVIHRGPISGIGETVCELYREWLPQSAFEHAMIADVERYDERFNCDGRDSEMEYWISVKAKATTK